MEPESPSSSWTIAAASVVFAIAIALRMPSCYESFWVDELHSAWTVWGNLLDVMPRANAGHQSPLYFLGLWFWKQAIGSSELALRMSSVIATSMGCIILTIGVARWTTSLVAGVTSGLILAIESNAIFFGTELRPYAFVLLLAAIAQICFLPLLASQSRLDHPRLWVSLILAVLLAASIQPTAIGVLALFPLVLLVHWTRNNPRELTFMSAVDGLLAIITVATALWLWKMTLGESWQDRSQWAAFGSATSVSQILEIWDWLWLWVVPLIVASLAVVISLRSATRPFQLRMYSTLIVLSLLAVAATCLYWVLAWCQFAPIWHRRYLVAVLPILACGCGLAVGVVSKLTVARGRMGALIPVAAGFALITGLGFHQGTIRVLPNYPVALVVRGEGWREAIAWIRKMASSEDQIHLDPGLIESDILFRDSTQEPSSAYLRFPVKGPYSVDREVELRSVDSLHPIRAGNGFTIGNQETSARQIFIVRRPATKLKRLQKGGEELLPFGGVTVILRPKALNTHN